MLICRAEGCSNFITMGIQAEKENLCMRCWEELTALEEMRRDKNERDRGEPPVGMNLAFA